MSSDQSTRLFVTRATGRLGSLVVDALLRTVPPGRIVAGVRDPSGEAARRIAGLGVELRITGYGRPETLDAAFRGIDRLLLISSSEIGQRVAQQHRQHNRW